MNIDLANVCEVRDPVLETYPRGVATVSHDNQGE